MFKTSSGALKKFVPDPKYIGCGIPEFFGSLHAFLCNHTKIYNVCIGVIIEGQNAVLAGSGERASKL